MMNVLSLRDALRVHGLAWSLLRDGSTKGSSDAKRLAILLQPGAPQETHCRVLAAQHAQPGEFFKIGERLLALLALVGVLSWLGQDQWRQTFGSV